MTSATRLLVGLLLATLGMAGMTGWLLADTLAVRYERDVMRMVFNDNLALLDELRLRAGLETDSLARLLSSTPQPSADQPYLVVSIEDHRLWYRSGDSVLFTTQVAVGSGRILERGAGGVHWKFETPRGRLAVVGKDTAPVWIPPDWHYVEEAQRRGLGIVRLQRGQSIPVGDGRTLVVAGSNVVVRSRDGRVTPVSASEGGEIVAGGNIVIPPFGTNQRKYRDVLGTHRLDLGNGYAIHGTNKPETIGRSVSHGCIRVRNEDIALLYELVPVGTPVFVY